MKPTSNIRLFLAPMEGLGSIEFRRAMRTIGGFDEASTEFIRISSNPHIPSLIKQYDPNALFPIPQAVQLMGQHPDQLAECADAFSKKGAPRIDLNCGCPSNTVTGHGAGSSLLKTPELLFSILSAMKKASCCPITAKLRIGFSDDSLFQENLFAAQEAGVAFITLHARTKVDGYGPPARWEYIRKAKELLSIPIVGNGDIITAKDAIRMLNETGCDMLMIGRGAAKNPWIFHEIKALLRGEEFLEQNRPLTPFLDSFFADMHKRKEFHGPVKQLAAFLFHQDPEKKGRFLRRQYESLDEIKEFLIKLLDLLPSSPTIS